MRVGGKYPNVWHYHHMMDPTTMSPGSIMPAYTFMAEREIDMASTPAKIRAMQTLGVPYPEGYDTKANDDLMKQANEIAADLKNNKVGIAANTEMIAIIAYLQRMGTDIKSAKVATNP
jgi:cytochrome c oxidase cbb3-type subunit I/II